MSTLDHLFHGSTSLEDYARRYANYLSHLLTQLDYEAIARAGAILEEARQAGRTIFLIGNGGSAATASHFANDIGLGIRKGGGRACRAISLSDNVAFLTAAGNDLGYESIFVEQLKTLMEAGDVVIAISASGNSPNIVAAMEYAAENGALTIGLTGFDGGRLRSLADVAIHIATPHGDYGPVEDLHLMVNHLLSSYLARLTAVVSHADELVRSVERSVGLIERRQHAADSARHLPSPRTDRPALVVRAVSSQRRKTSPARAVGGEGA